MHGLNYYGEIDDEGNACGMGSNLDYQGTYFMNKRHGFGHE